MRKLREENLELKKKFREFKKKMRQEVDKEIEGILSKWTIKIAGGFMILGMIIGRFAR